MNKTIFIYAFFFASLAYAKALRIRCAPVCQKDVYNKIVCVRNGKDCRKMNQCSLQEENCQRRIINRPLLFPTHLSLCRYIKSTEGYGECAKVRVSRSTPKPHRPNCNNIRCTIPTDKPQCYRSKKNNCRLLTSCQLARINCLRGQHNLLERIDSRACEGMKDVNCKQKCRPIPKRG